ncbi:hypothetical protein ScPMuIL_003529 [Solemya velum]
MPCVKKFIPVENSPYIHLDRLHANVVYCASNIVGRPVVFPCYGDIPGTWAPSSSNNLEFIEMEFAELLFITNIDVYETYNAGAITRISARRPGGTWHSIWSGTPTALPRSSIFTPNIVPTAFKTKQLRLDIDCSACGSWTQIDGVRVTGVRHQSRPPSTEQFCSELEKMVNNPLFSDVTISVGGKKFHAHRAILAAHSDYFSTVFSNHMEGGSLERPVEIQGDIRSDVFLAVLHYLYTNTVPRALSCDMLTSVWRVAHQFNIESLKELAVYKVEETLDTENVVKVYNEATTKQPVIEKIQEMCLDYISNNVHAVSQSPAFVDSPRGIMLEIIQRATAKLTI